MFRTLLYALATVAALAIPFAPAVAAPASDTRPLQQVAGILEYIAGDYRQAVTEDGRMLQQSEYDEQLSLAGEAEALAAQAGLPTDDVLRQRLATLRRALLDKQGPSAVARFCHDARTLIVERYGVTLSPASAPSREEGARLYVEQGCVSCHGADGSADTEAARKLSPRPANFLDPARVAAVSPYRAFHAISFGLAGTAMQAYPQLRDAQRFSLAFYVLSLRHAAADLDAGQRVLERSAVELPRSASGLALLTDEDILRALGGLASEAERAQALSYLRARAPFVAAGARPNDGLAEARRGLNAGLLAYRAGDRAKARRTFVAAYLDGFEPHEAAIGAHDPALVREVERGMLALRQAAARGEEPEHIAALVRKAELSLARAEGGRGDATTALIGAFTISLREGLEIALLIGALLALVRKRGLPELVKYVHAGWMLAAAGGLLTWWSVGALLSGLQRELAEGIATLVAAGMLLGVTHWLLGQITAKRFMGFLAERMREAASSRAAWGVLGLSFVASYREAFEIVLFFKALLLDARESQSRVWLGAGLGLLVLALVALVLKRIGQRLQPRPFMLVSSALLSLLVFAMTGNGIHALQEAAVVGMTELSVPSLPVLGVYPTLESLAAQALVLLFLLGSAAWPLLRRRRDRAQSAQGEPGAAAP
jgi:high-affinity iron transporter